MSDTCSTECAGHIVLVHFPHLDTIDIGCRRNTDPASKDFLYTVKGKPRPMLIIGTNGKPAFGTQWYLVLKLTTADCNPEKAVRLGYVDLGYLLKCRVISYADREPWRLPGNLFEKRLKTIDRFTLKCIFDTTGITLGGLRR